MKIHLISVGDKMPSWIKAGFEEYVKRIPKEYEFNLIEVAPQKSKDMLKKIPSKSIIIALDEHGECWDTKILSHHLETWKASGKNIALLIGGADGIPKEILNKVNKQWSLSRLTFPHMLVRVLVAEQIYRAFSILSGHPYHRA
jgi:23S rRNA (pseudouridine1915-N3)-methyltransferase